MANDLPEYILNLLNAIAKSEGFADYSFETAAGSKPGDGFAGIMTSVTITGDRQVDGHKTTNKLHLLCKLAPENAARREEFHSESMFNREVYAYNNILPLFAEFQRERGLSDDESFNSYPKCYAAIADAEKNQFALIMEDLRPRQFVMWPKEVPLAKNHAYSIVERLAKLHAISFALKDQRPDIYDSLRVVDDVLLKFFESSNATKIMLSGYDRAIAALENSAHVKIMQEVKDQMVEILREVLGEGVSDPFGVIGHGDCWINNMLFQYKDDTKDRLEDICFVDWQLARFGSPVLDLVYSLFSCTDKAFRDAHYDQLMRHYHISLSTQIRRLGSDPDFLFAFTDLQGQLKKFGRFAFVMIPVIIQMLLIDPKDLPNLDEMSEKMSEGNVDLVKGYDEKTQKEYNKRQNDLLEDLVSLGYWNTE